MLRKKYVHPLQYLIVGFAIMLFYLLLLSLAEYLLFDLAYAISATGKGEMRVLRRIFRRIIHKFQSPARN